MQPDEPVVVRYGLARTATLTMLGDGRGEGDERERREAAEEGAAAEEAAEQVARRGELAARDCARAEHLPRMRGRSAERRLGAARRWRWRQGMAWHAWLAVIRGTTLGEACMRAWQGKARHLSGDRGRLGGEHEQQPHLERDAVRQGGV